MYEEKYIAVENGIKNTVNGMVYKDFHIIADLLNMKDEEIAELEEELDV